MNECENAKHLQYIFCAIDTSKTFDESIPFVIACISFRYFIENRVLSAMMLFKLKFKYPIQFTEYDIEVNDRYDFFWIAANLSMFA